MKKRFFYEFIVGIICLIAVLYFSNLGMVAFALMAAHPFVGKIKADERESQLFHQVGNLTAAVTLLACVIIYLASDVEINGNSLGDFWLGPIVASFLIAHGGVGLFAFRKI